jgi:hypothetical protein
MIICRMMLPNKLRRAGLYTCARTVWTAVDGGAAPIALRRAEMDVHEDVGRRNARVAVCCLT